MATTYVPRSIETTGASLTGSDGDSNRAYTLTHTNVVAGSIQITAGGAVLYRGSGKDFTVSGQTITFLNAMFDDMDITIRYFTSTVAATPSEYATTGELARFMGVEGTVPNREDTGQDRYEEEVGTGGNSATGFFLDNAFVIADSYTISKGTNVTSLSALTETTHYTMDIDDGKITLTTGGITEVSTDKIYAEYKYFNIGVTDTEAQDAIDRATKEVDQRTNNHWADGSGATPDYNQIDDEKQTGRGPYYRDYFTFRRPIPNVSTNISAVAVTGATTITVGSTDGFLSSGTIGVDRNKISYTGKSATTFNGCSGVSATLATGTTVNPFVVEYSTTMEGSVPTWQVLQVDDDYDFVRDTGKVRLYNTNLLTQTDSIRFDNAPGFLVPNRFRTTYIWGNTSIPEDIKRVTLMLASKDIMHMAVRKAHSSGQNQFDPGPINVDQEWIDLTIERYRNYRASNI